MYTYQIIEKEGREAYIPYGYRLIEKRDSGNNIYENQYAWILIH